jgi:hypothetical protein
VIPAAVAASVTTSSRIDPPGWTIAFTPTAVGRRAGGQRPVGRVIALGVDRIALLHHQATADLTEFGSAAQRFGSQEHPYVLRARQDRG